MIVSSTTFDFIVRKVWQKLLGWDARKLSLVGRITLATSVFLSIPNYFTYTVRVLSLACTELKRSLVTLFGDQLLGLDEYPYSIGMIVASLLNLVD